MSIFNFNLSSFGLDITDRNLKIVQAVPTRKKHRLQAWGDISLKPGVIEEGEIVDRAEVFASAKKLRETVHGKLTSDLAVVSLPEAKSFIKLLSIAKPEVDAKEEVLIKQIEEELPKQIPLPVDSLVYDHQVITENNSSWDVLVGAVSKELIKEYTDLVKTMGFKPLALEIEAQSIMRAVLPAEYQNSHTKKLNKFNSSLLFSFGKKKKALQSQQTKKVTPSQSTQFQPVVIADLGASRSSMIIYHHGAMKFTRTVELSGNQLTAEIAEKLSLTPAKAEQAKVICGLDKRKCKGQVSPIMDSWVDVLQKELLETIEYYASVEGIDPITIKDVLLCGGAASLVGLSEILSTNLKRNVKCANPLWQFVDSPNSAMAIPGKSVLGYTTAIGLALR